MKNIYKSYLSYLISHKHEMLNRYIVFQLPYEILRSENASQELRDKGAYFSGDELVNFLFKENLFTNERIYDPAAGCGDLLVRYLDRLELASSFDDTLIEWEKNVFATECESSFVELLKLRLWLLAFLKHHGETILGEIILPDLRERFPGVVCCDALSNLLKINPTLIIMNPPFQQIDSLGAYPWCSGKVSLAAVFLYEMLKRYPNAYMSAILPDVLRSGSRYEKLRRLFGFNMESIGHIYGRFDSLTDVDVFIFNHDPNHIKKMIENKEQDDVVISDIFDVHVGSVVPYRDVKKGKSCFYLSPENVPPGATISLVNEKLKSLHKPVRGPFVILRRTSSPSDKIRCVSSIINSNREFHLDNHLIYIKPKNQKSALEQCQKIHNFFLSSECSDLMNHLIRCRHLTVRIIRNLKYKGGN